MYLNIKTLKSEYKYGPYSASDIFKWISLEWQYLNLIFTEPVLLWVHCTISHKYLRYCLWVEQATCHLLSETVVMPGDIIRGQWVNSSQVLVHLKCKWGRGLGATVIVNHNYCSRNLRLLTSAINNFQIKIDLLEFLMVFVWSLISWRAAEWKSRDCIVEVILQHFKGLWSNIRDQSRNAPSQWDTSLHCNNISH